MICAAVVAAYGAGQDGTALAPYEPLGACSAVQRLVRALQNGGVRRIVLLTSPEDQPRLEKHMAHWGVLCRSAPAMAGTVAPLQAGIRALSGRCGRLLFTAVDTPFLSPETVRALSSADAPLCRPVFDGQPGGVLGVGADCFPAILAAPAELPLSGLPGRLAAELVPVPVDDPGALAGGRERYPALLERRRQEPIQVTFKLRLCRERPFFGPGTVQLLNLIDDTDSVRLACQQMGISYSKAWKMIALMEEELGQPVVLRRQGGKNGGAASLTPAGRALLEKYQLLEQRCQALIEQASREIFSPLP